MSARRDLPLAGRRVLVTRPTGRGDALSLRLASLGADVVSAPLLRIEPANDAGIGRALDAEPPFDWVVVTSVHAARALADGVREGRAHAPCALHATEAPGPRVCAVGAATAAVLTEAGVRVDAVPGEPHAEALVDHLLAGGLTAAQRVLFVRGDRARDVVPRRLRDHGVSVEEVVAYRTVLLDLDTPGGPPVTAMIRAHEIDVVVLTSGRAARHFADQFRAAGLDAATESLAIVCIGPVTADAARATGLRVSAVAGNPAVESLVEAIAASCRHLGAARR